MCINVSSSRINFTLHHSPEMACHDFCQAIQTLKIFRAHGLKWGNYTVRLAPQEVCRPTPSSKHDEREREMHPKSGTVCCPTRLGFFKLFTPWQKETPVSQMCQYFWSFEKWMGWKKKYHIASCFAHLDINIGKLMLNLWSIVSSLAFELNPVRQKEKRIGLSNTFRGDCMCISQMSWYMQFLNYRLLCSELGVLFTWISMRSKDNAFLNRVTPKSEKRKYSIVQF